MSVTIPTIAVIEDDPSSLELVRYLLGAHGYTAWSASRGDEGLELVRRERPDLVICDIHLPGLDGYAIARAIKADPSLRATRLVAVTALAMVGDRDKILAAGFDWYLTKPIDPSTFVTQIAPMLGVSGAERAAPAAIEPAVRATPARRGTILVVDDTPVNLDLKRSIFEPVGFCVVTASNGAAGLHLALDVLPDLIISDVGLPDESGLELLRKAKAHASLRNIPVVIITSTHTEPALRVQALQLGAARFLIRPMEASSVLSEVEAVLAEAQGAARGSDPHHR